MRLHLDSDNIQLKDVCSPASEELSDVWLGTSHVPVNKFLDILRLDAERVSEDHCVVLSGRVGGQMCESVRAIQSRKKSSNNESRKRSPDPIISSCFRCEGRVVTVPASVLSVIIMK